MNYSKFDYIVVGSGFFGSVLAERIARIRGKRVLLIEKRDHVGGNSYSAVDEETGIEIHRYGSHIFHTNKQAVWEYITKFTTFNHYRHKVLTLYRNKIYQMPINLATINSFFNISLKPSEVSDFIGIEIEKENIEDPQNFEEVAISLIGRTLYEAFIRGYTLKQWETDPRLLPATMFNRIPLRNNYDSHYFNDPWQGIPLMGYGNLIERILSHENIKLQLRTDFFDIRSSISKNARIIYSGPIDRFFDYKHGRLGWRTSYFKKEAHNCCDFQGTSVVNYAEEKYDFTRIHEFKHYHPERETYQKDVTLVFKEYSKFTEGLEDPYYPINTPEDREKYGNYLRLAGAEKNVIFGGRLGSYRYLNMDDAIGEALYVFNTLP